jgi:hypothetical protein
VNASAGFSAAIQQQLAPGQGNGCMTMSESSQKEPAPEDRYLKKMLGIIRSKGDFGEGEGSGY